MASILLTDDVAVVRMTIRRFLERGGHTVRDCDSADAAEQILSSQSFDILVTDLWMPGRDGLTLIAWVKAQHRGMPIIAVTGGAPRTPQVFSMEEAARAGADRVLMKPVGMQELLSAVTDLIGSRI
ncbi:MULTISPECIES: response regulator [Methylobacterium]|uniref:Transcriptional regulatory protein OmpR n=1 Tax=Methylobacterium bullatum TaxID=570505 RepID=A0AAV4Z6J9_9HYPH|nr:MULTISPECIES: response regulator [Methylobacterium]KQO54069.1 transcriptional regulator [Methylobacterium sp. Leaf85]MBD8901234.1 response regulator [Methylobacterium bullatum]GJD39164.1 Transcriptional regulatory protein OmpR [Methylobacterium bullatum]